MISVPKCIGGFCWAVELRVTSDNPYLRESSLAWSPAQVLQRPTDFGAESYYGTLAMDCLKRMRLGAQRLHEGIFTRSQAWGAPA